MELEVHVDGVALTRVLFNAAVVSSRGEKTMENWRSSCAARKMTILLLPGFYPLPDRTEPRFALTLLDCSSLASHAGHCMLNAGCS
ncbi:hypothetical protein E2562_004941 [Oryza meyeriana var. granulata]|uniref:Uncharacterized protein n=1 Tax=Oryza meyeriana var. granulata TaxID=110450 RepID=A0A6G1C2Q9_9ORYZ|nr:hypothetical protein E2562_004941 [Oryza meyeriana var. granulata]